MNDVDSVNVRRCGGSVRFRSIENGCNERLENGLGCRLEEFDHNVARLWEVYNANISSRQG